MENERFLKPGDRTVDQMLQAARSGKENILEGSKAAKTSSEFEIKLTNVAGASLEELSEDYHDYLRTRELPLWKKDSKEVSYIMICLINPCNYLLDKQILNF